MEVYPIYSTIAGSKYAKKADILLLSGVVQYLHNPHDFLNDLKGYNFEYVLIDRTSFINDLTTDRLTLQVVPPEIYETQYPSWFFNEEAFMKHFNDYKIKSEFESFVPSEQEIQIDNKIQVTIKISS